MGLMQSDMTIDLTSDDVRSTMPCYLLFKNIAYVIQRHTWSDDCCASCKLHETAVTTNVLFLVYNILDVYICSFLFLFLFQIRKYNILLYSYLFLS